jgi:hypothetical protein
MPARKYLSAVVAASILAYALPALAHDDDDDDDDHHHHHHRHYERHIEHGYYYAPQAIVPAPAYLYEAPRPVVVYPSAPPPTVVYEYTSGGYGDALVPLFFGALVGGYLGHAGR